jgi:predicted small lipoprotein YifL
MRNAKTILTLAVIAVIACLAGCGDKEAEEAAARKRAEEEAAKIVMKQGNGKVRKWGESGFADVSKVVPPVPASGVSSDKGK